MTASSVIEDQLKKVEYADLSRYDSDEMTYVIPKRTDIKLEEDNCYLIQIHRSFFNNQTVCLNWNSGSVPPSEYMKIDISKIMGKMIKVIGIVYDMVNNCCKDIFWNGWLSTEELTVISKT